MMFFCPVLHGRFIWKLQHADWIKLKKITNLVKCYLRYKGMENRYCPSLVAALVVKYVKMSKLPLLSKLLNLWSNIVAETRSWQQDRFYCGFLGLWFWFCVLKDSEASRFTITHLSGCHDRKLFYCFISMCMQWLRRREHHLSKSQ